MFAIMFAIFKMHEGIYEGFWKVSLHEVNFIDSDMFHCFSRKSDLITKAGECYKQSLKYNPFLWGSFEALCQIGITSFSLCTDDFFLLIGFFEAKYFHKGISRKMLWWISSLAWTKNNINQVWLLLFFVKNGELHKTFNC